jgi:seryl-tRNA synthetase
MVNAKVQTEAEKEFFSELVRHGLVLPSPVPGIVGRGRAFEDVLRGLDQLIFSESRADGAEFMNFPPVIGRRTIEKSEFLDSFPQLAGSVWSFTGNDAEHQELSERVHAGRDWSDLQSMTDVVLTPAACYPVYPLATGRLPDKGRTVELVSWCFRHEPSGDPARMQMFRVHEIVRLGEPDTVRDWRNLWLERGVSLLSSLGLDVRAAPASDPFFGRGGRMLAASQKEQSLKFEILTPICSEENPTAVVSFNYHQQHFGKIFEIQTSKGVTAETACLGFGLERCVLALFKTHGMVPREWPDEVRTKLGL